MAPSRARAGRTRRDLASAARRLYGHPLDYCGTHTSEPRELSYNPLSERNRGRLRLGHRVSLMRPRQTGALLAALASIARQGHVSSLVITHLSSHRGYRRTNRSSPVPLTHVLLSFASTVTSSAATHLLLRRPGRIDECRRQWRHSDHPDDPANRLLLVDLQ